MGSKSLLTVTRSTTQEFPHVQRPLLLPLLSSFCVTFLVLLFTSSALAQDASNKRGFQPGNSFAIGDFETINTTNGNLMLRFPWELYLPAAMA